MQPSRIHHVGLPVSDLDLSVAWYREALGLTHESTAGVPEGVAFMVAPTGERLGRKPWTDGTQLMRDTDARRSGNIPERWPRFRSMWAEGLTIERCE